MLARRTRVPRRNVTRPEEPHCNGIYSKYETIGNNNGVLLSNKHINGDLPPVAIYLSEGHPGRHTTF
jgi:hypothetical protein